MADAVVPAAGSGAPAAGAAGAAAQPEKPGLAQLLMKVRYIYLMGNLILPPTLASRSSRIVAAAAAVSR